MPKQLVLLNSSIIPLVLQTVNKDAPRQGSLGLFFLLLIRRGEIKQCFYNQPQIKVQASIKR